MQSRRHARMYVDARRSGEVEVRRVAGIENKDGDEAVVEF